MNDLKMLHEVGTELDPPVLEPPATLRGRVLTAMTGRRPSRAWPLLPPFGWRLAAVGGLAVALTAGLFAAQTLSLGDHAPAAEAAAAEILQNAARTAQQQPDLSARPDQFVFVESATAYPAMVAAGAENRADTSNPEKLRRIWLSVDGTREGLLRTRPQSGSGGWDETALEACEDGKVVQSKGGKSVVQSCAPIPAYLGALPTDVDGMYRYLYDNRRGGKLPDAAAFVTVGDLIRENYVSPRALAAMFKAAAKIPGTTVIRDSVDAAGRHGVAVAQLTDHVRSELIFDPKTYAYLGERTVAVEDFGGWHKGDVTGGAARLRIAIVDRAGQLP